MKPKMSQIMSLLDVHTDTGADKLPNSTLAPCPCAPPDGSPQPAPAITKHVSQSDVEVAAAFREDERNLGTDSRPQQSDKRNRGSGSHTVGGDAETSYVSSLSLSQGAFIPVGRKDGTAGVNVVNASSGLGIGSPGRGIAGPQPPRNGAATTALLDSVLISAGKTVQLSPVAATAVVQVPKSTSGKNLPVKAAKNPTVVKPTPRRNVYVIIYSM
jgi:hypothetical protein